MAYYHLSVSVISRSAGRSAVACAAYRSGSELADARYGVVHDYRPRRGIAAIGIAAPTGAPTWVLDREALWNEVETKERRKDAQLSREFVLAFPSQLDMAERLALLHSFIEEQLVSRGLVADWAIHAPSRAGDERNWHAHVMTTLRCVDSQGLAAAKDRSLNTHEQLGAWRAAWADLQNRCFERLGIRDQEGELLMVDHRSYEARGVPLEPTQHLGSHATAMERAGKPTDRGDVNRAVLARNAALVAVRRQAHDLTQESIRTRLSARCNAAYRERQRDHDFER